MLKHALIGLFLLLGPLPSLAYAASTQPPKTVPHHQSMNEARFWQLIRDTKHRSKGDSELQVRILQEELTRLPAGSIVAFERILARQREKAYHWRLWGAAYLLNGGCSDDCFDYFQGWLISQGREVFERALDNPDTLAEQVAGTPEGEYENEQFLYVALEAYLAKTDREMADPHPISKEVKGKRWQERDLEHLLPRLWKKSQAQER